MDLPCDRGLQVGQAGEGIEGRAFQREGRWGSNRDRSPHRYRETIDARLGLRRVATGIRPLVREVLRPRQPPKERHRVHPPLREAVDQPLHRIERALASTQRDGVRHVCPDCPGVSRQVTAPQAIGQIGQDPLAGRLDEEVVIQPLDVGVHLTEGILDQAQEGRERAALDLFEILEPIDLRQARIQGYAKLSHRFLLHS